MEIVIIICLWIIIVLLLQDKVVIQWKSEKKPPQQKVSPSLSDIMGQPRPIRSRSMSNTTAERQNIELEINPNNLDIEYDKNENVSIQIPQEELDKTFRNIPDLAKEEEELKRYGRSDNDDGFTQGVTFEELNDVGVLLKKEKLETAQKETAIAIVQKIQGTELFSLLESSMDDASRKISELLDSSLSNETQDSSSTLRKNDLNDFDIGEFV